MRVLHIANDYYGTELYKNLFRRQNATNIETKVVVPLNIKSKENIESDVVDLFCYNSLDRFSYFLKQSKIIKSINKNINVKTFNIIHAHTVFSSGYAAMQLYKELGVPYVVAVRNTDYNLFFKRLIFLRKTGIDILYNAASVIYLSPAYKKGIEGKYIPKSKIEIISQKSIVLPNGIDDFWFDHLCRKKIISENPSKISIVTVGEISKNKNQLVVCKAIEILIMGGYECSYTLIGNITDRNYFSQIEQFSFVKYVPHMPKEELINYYRKADIFVLPSINETFGLVYAEAMSQGLPVLYSIGQGFDGQFEEGSVGYHVDAKSPQDIANKIEKVLYKYALLSNNSVSSVEKFRWDSIAKQYEIIYEMVR